MKNKNKLINWLLEEGKKYVLILWITFCGMLVIDTNYKYLLADMIDIPNVEAKTQGEAILSATGDITIQEHVINIMKDEFNLSWPEIAKALSVIQCESSFNPYAIGDSGKSTGLWQIHSGYHKDISTKDTFDVYASTRWAVQKYIDSGRSWKLWSCGR